MPTGTLSRINGDYVVWREDFLIDGVWEPLMFDGIIPSELL